MASINTVFTLTDNFTPRLERMNKSLNSVVRTMVRINHSIYFLHALENGIRSLTSYTDELYDAYAKQEEREMKLATVMRQRLGSTNEEIDYIKRLADEQERLGIYSDTMIKQGAQELATFVTQKEQLDILIPALGHLVAQQYGYTASANDMRNSATRMGKVLSGQLDSLSRMGYIFDDAQKRVLKTGNEMEKSAKLAEIITQNVGEMNYALRMTSIGRIIAMQNELEDLKERAGDTTKNFALMKKSIEIDFESKKIDLYLKAIDYIQNHTREAGVAIMGIGTTIATVATIMAGSWAIIHWPITLVVAGIALVIDIMNSMSVTAQQVGSFVGSIIQGIYVLIHYVINIIENSLIFMVNRVISIHNFFKSIFEALPNLLSDPLNTMKQMFVSFATFVMRLFEPFLGLFDAIFKTKLSESLKNSMKELQDWANKNAKNKVDFESANLYGYKEYYQGDFTKGAQIGASVGEKVEGYLGILNENLEGINLNFNGKGSVLVSDDELIDIASDYRELLSRRAIEKFNLQFAQVTPSINIDNVVVNKEVDATRVFDEMTNALDEYANSSLTR